MIGKLITNLLTTSVELTALVPATSMYPYMANEDTPSPYIVYRINGIEPDYTKDGWWGDLIEVSVASFSPDYASLQDIAVAVRAALEWEDGTYDGITYWHFQTTGQLEGFSDEYEVYGNILTFTVRVTAY